MLSKYILQTVEISKKYGKSYTIDHINLNIKQGDIYGIIGLNGAGKSTLIRLITGLTYPTAGKIELFSSFNEQELHVARQRIGALIESPALFPNMTAQQNLEVIRIQRGIPGNQCIHKMLEKVGLTDTGKKKVKAFSLGMKQRLGIAVAMLHDPEFLILDEPINGLDPMGVIEIRQLLKQLNEEYGITILISSHILSEVHQIATHYGFIHHGKLIEEISAKYLDEKCQAHFLIGVDDHHKAVTVLENELNTTDYEVMPDGNIKLFSHYMKEIIS